MLRATPILILAALTAAFLPTTAQAGWKTERAATIARIVWHHPCVDRMQLGWVPQATLDNETGTPDVVAAAHPDACRVDLSLGQPLTWDSFCAVILHEAGHLAGYRDPLNPEDPVHSHNPKSVMYGGPAHPSTSQPTILFPVQDPRCDDNGRPYLEAHGALS